MYDRSIKWRWIIADLARAGHCLGVRDLFLIAFVVRIESIVTALNVDRIPVLQIRFSPRILIRSEVGPAGTLIVR